MFRASDEAIGISAVLRVLDRPLVFRGEWALRKVAKECRAPELLETWRVSSTTSMSEGS